MRSNVAGNRMRWLAHVLLPLSVLTVTACGSSVATRPPTTIHPSSTPTPKRLPLQVAPAPTPMPADQAPARLVIATMGLDAPIVPVGADASGAMVVPRNPNPHDRIWSSVYWWDLGVPPGQAGNAVIAGHVNRPDASPATFTRLDVLAPGDHIEVLTSGGQTLTFVVTSKETPLIGEHDPGDPAFIRVFGPSLTPNLNLITCWGEWIGNTFNRRLVVHSSLATASTSDTRHSSDIVKYARQLVISSTVDVAGRQARYPLQHYRALETLLRDRSPVFVRVL